MLLQIRERICISSKVISTRFNLMLLKKIFIKIKISFFRYTEDILLLNTKYNVSLENNK